MADPQPPEPSPPPAEDEIAPWERGAKKPENKPAAGVDTGWHDTRRKERTRRPQIALTVALFFGLAGLIAALILNLSPPDPTIEFHGLPVQHYRLDWVSNPTAQRDAEELLKHFHQADGLGSAAQQGNKFREQLERMNDLRREGGAPFVLFVSALSVVRDGKVYILPGDARLDGPDPASTWVPLSSVLAAMNNCTSKDKALLLDLARTPADPFRGPLSDDVTTAIDAEIATFDPKYPVLTSCSPGEQSLVIPEAQLSAFAAYFAEGLTGEADGYHGGEQPDKRITFAEVADYTICRVSQWAYGVPDRRQIPKRYGPDGNDFRLYYNRTRKPPPAEDAPPPDPPKPYPVALREAWKQRDSYRELGRYLAPDLMFDLESRLLRAEADYLAGFEVADPRQDTSWKATVALMQSRTALASPLKSSTLLELRAGRPPFKPELKAALERWIGLRFPPVDDAGKPIPVSQTESEKHEAELEKLLEGEAALDGFAYYWQKILEDASPTAERITRIGSLLERPPFSGLARHNASELILFRRIAKAKLPATVTPDAIRSLLHAEQALSEALVAVGGRLPEGFHRVRALLDEADRRKQKAEAALFAPRPTSLQVEAASEELKQAAIQLKAAGDGAGAVRDAHRAVADAAWRLHAVLPAVVAWNRPDASVWQRTAGGAGELAALLAGPLEPSGLLRLKKLTDDLIANEAKLTTHSPNQLKQLEEESRVRPESSAYATLLALLAGPALPADDRAAIAEGFRKVSHSRYCVERAKFEKDHVVKPRLDHEPWEKPVLRSRRRAIASIEMLQFANDPKAGELNLALQIAADDAGRWQTLSDGSINSWNRVFRIAVDEQRKSPRAVERILRAAPPRLDGFDRESGFGNLFASEERDRRKWLVERFVEYGMLRAGVPGASGFYARLAEDHRFPLTDGPR